MVGSPRRTPVSIVCVFNDPEVRVSCLDRSIRAGLDEAPDTEYIPVDNTSGQYASAGAALNAGARRARHGVVVLVHQDVYLHSLAALERAAGALEDDPSTGLVGAVGVAATGSVAGVVRDRVVIIGRQSSAPVPVDSLDEVLFMIEADRLHREPLSEDPDLAWHAYAVEYGARVRRQGLRVVAADIPLTHNSMTTNLDRLAEAHARVAQLYPELVPLRTTCGIVRDAHRRSRFATLLRRRHGAATWIRESVTATDLARRVGSRTSDVLLADIRLLIDDALDALGASGLDILNLDVPAPDVSWDVAELRRRERDVSAARATVDDVVASLGESRRERAVLVTGPDRDAIARLAPTLRATEHVVGLTRDIGTWVLVHPEAAALRALCTSRRNAPFALNRRPSGGAARAAGGTPAEAPG
ncbi:glycosyltransferase [Actinotalea sp.]|uniref:glycosyltransferase n=1 Tax=Actinotalea sp. TaxID=1872145 RepID=UPI003569B3DD